MDVYTDAIYDSATPDGCCSLRKTLPDGTYQRLAVVPGDFAAVEAFAPELLAVFQALWTPGVIQAYQDSLPPPDAPEPDSTPPAPTNAALAAQNLSLAGAIAALYEMVSGGADAGSSPDLAAVYGLLVGAGKMAAEDVPASVSAE